MSDCIEGAPPQPPQDVGDLPPTTAPTEPATNTICINTSEMPQSHIMALDQLIQLQCNKLEKQLVALKVKRQLLHMGEGVVLSVNDLMSDVSTDCSKELIGSLEAASAVEGDGDDRFKYFRSQTAGADISEIVNSMNRRKSSSDESDDFMRRVQFTAVEEPDNGRAPIARRCTTLPEGHGPATASELLFFHVDIYSAGDDERFVPTVRFKRAPKEVKPRSDARFARLFESDEGPRKGGPKIDPFGRPLGDVYDEDSSSSDDESEESAEELAADSTTEADEKKDDIEYGEASNRLAVVGCDWDNINASDLFVLFETMYRTLTSNHTGCVRRAAVYLSDFGKERLEHENLHGPSLQSGEDLRDEELDETARQEALRKYQAERARYYYGIVEFEGEEPAKLLYDEMDGIEADFAFSGLDLRFVPSDITFEREPTSECFEIPSNYEPPLASTSAFRHSRVECKWDMPSMKRFKTLTKKFKEQDIESLELQEYLASDDEEVDVSKYKSLLTEKPEPPKPVKTDDGRVKTKVGKYTISFGAPEGIPDLAEIDLASKKTRKAKSKSKRDRDSADLEADDVRDFDARKPQEQQPGFQGDFEDRRFNRVLKDPDFAIDTRHPKYRVRACAFCNDAVSEHGFQQESPAEEVRVKTFAMSINFDTSLLRRFLLAGGDGTAAEELLRNVSVEEIVLSLSQLGDECFPSSYDYESDGASAASDHYLGILLVRVLDKLLTKDRTRALLQNQQVADLLSQRVPSSSYPVRRLFASKCELYFCGSDSSSESLENVLWELLLDPEYRIFEHCSRAISAILRRRPGSLDEKRLEMIRTTMRDSDSDSVISVRMAEFCAHIGGTSDAVFKTLLDAGLCSALLDLYMNADSLVKLNILELLDRNAVFVSRLLASNTITHDFIAYAISVTTGGGDSSDNVLLAPYLLRMMLSMLPHKNILTPEDCKSLSRSVSGVIMESNAQKASPLFLSALQNFGTLYLLGYIPAEVCRNLEEKVNSTVDDRVIASMVASLDVMCEAGLESDKFAVLRDLTRCVVAALSRFPFSDVRETAYCYLLKALKYDDVVLDLLDHESKTRLFSSEENLHANTVAKKRLTRQLVKRMDELSAGSASSMGNEGIALLRK
ncbi:pre-rRNA-processing ESF1 [Babesia ovata]|uniref:Pre-rRNA-processing ESF1 n=1 Tax=Babesia ovata TaxID=189622 RepID=A0A2H6KJC7_9APIC|nr:pre-rRNA-processing ESF1 [Babesia ovata]GBE63079.1 pre-rRNA-processing ESF1 [Babesia ovata]